MRPPGIRRRLLLTVVAAVGIAVAALVVAFNLIIADTLDGDARDLARARAAAELALLTTERGRLVVREAPDAAGPDTAIWVFSRGAALERPRAGADVEAAARSVAAGAPGVADVATAGVRLVSLPVVADGRRVGAVVAGVSLAPYARTRRLTLVASVALGGAVLLLVALASRWLLGSALRPVRRMTRQAAAWSERDLDRRFGLGAPRDELTELAATLDALLDRLAASLRREQRFSAEMSHELRTPLARLLAECELALRREREPHEYRRALRVVHDNASRLTGIVDALLIAARHEAGHQRGTADAHATATEAAAGHVETAARRGLRLEVAAPQAPLRVAVDARLVERILQPIVDNACRHGVDEVRLSIDRVGGRVRYTIADDGPGVAAPERERIFEPGVRGDHDGADGGAGLGLALARRLARSVDGDVACVADGAGGRFVVTLPSA